MSRSTKNRLRLAAEIAKNGRPVSVPCDFCLLSNSNCIAMEGTARPKCSECVRRGKSCVNLSWESLDSTREEYRKKVEEDEKLLSEVLARLLRNKKILREAEERAKKKTLCLLSEMEKTGELESSSEESVDAPSDPAPFSFPDNGCPAADALTGLSPAVWTMTGFLDDTVNGWFGGPLEPVDTSGGG